MSTECLHAQYPKARLFFLLFMTVIKSTGFSDSANPVVRHLKSLKVRACEVRSGEEACCYSVGSKRESRPIEDFFFAFSTYIEYLQRKGEICMLKVVVQSKAVST